MILQLMDKTMNKIRLHGLTETYSTPDISYQLVVLRVPKTIMGNDIQRGQHMYI